MDTQTFHPAPTKEEGFVPQEKPINPRGDEITSQSNIELPFSQYEAFKNVPYSVEYFDIENFEYLNDLTDVNNVRSKIAAIESYVMKQINDNQLEDKLVTYQDILAQFMAAIGIDKNETNLSKLDKLAKYVKVLGRKSPIDLEKDLLKRQELMKQNFQTKEKTYQEKMASMEEERKQIAIELNRIKAVNRQLENEKNLMSKKVNDYKETIEKYINFN